MPKKIEDEQSELSPDNGGKLSIFDRFKPIGPKLISFFKNLPSFFKKVPPFFKNLFTIPKDPQEFRKKLVVSIIAIVLLLIIIAVVVFGIGIYKYDWRNRPAKWAQKIIPYPAATVGANVILVKNYNQRVEYLEYYFDKIKQEPEEGYQKLTLEEMIDQKIIEREANKLGITVTNEEIDEQYQNIILEEGSEEQVVKLLTELWGFDLGYFKGLIRDTLLTEKLKKEIPIAVHLKHILYKIDGGTEPQKQEEILAQARKLKGLIVEGQSFPENAKKYSEDTATRDNGGDLNWLTREQITAQLSEDCSETVMNLPVGDLSICRSKQGFDIIQIDEKRGKVDKSFNAWFEEIKAKTHIWRFIGQ